MPEIDIILKAANQASGPIKQVDHDLKALEGSAKKANSGGFASLKTMMGAGLVAAATAASAAIAGVGIALTKSVSAAADMEQGLADIRASMGLSAQETADLQKHIMELGLDPKLKVSATEAADAIMTLGTAGLSTTEIMGGASKATVLLANATGADFATAATVATDIMGQFNIEAEDLGDVVNQVTGATVASKFGINDMALAYSQAGGVAGAVGVSFEDFNAALAATSSSFASGSDAGTSFKTFLTTLLPKSAEAADVMRDLGLYTGLTGKEFDDMQGKVNKVKDRIADLDPTSKNFGERLRELQEEQRELNASMVEGGSAFFDAEGKMRGMEEIAGALQNAFDGLSDAERNHAAETIFGTDAMRTAFELIDGGTPLITKMKAEIGKTDAEESAATRMDTFSGSMEIAQGVIETLSISIGEKFLPVLKPMIERFTVLAQVHGPKLVEFFGDLADRMASALEQGFKWAEEVLPPLWQRMVDVGKAIGVVVDEVKKAIKPFTDVIAKTIGWDDVLTALGILLGSAMVAALGSFIVALAPVITLIAKVTLVVAALHTAWEENFLGIRDITEDVLDKIADWIKLYTGLWKGDWGKTIDYFIKTPDALNHMWGVIKRIFSEQTNEVRHVVQTWISVLQIKIGDWIDRVKSDIELGWGWIVRYFNDFKDKAIEKMEALLAWWDTHIAPWLEFGRELVQGLWDGVKEVWRRFVDWFTGSWDGLVHDFQDFFGIASPSRVFWGFGEEMMAGLQMGVKDGAVYVKQTLEDMSQVWQDVVTGQWIDVFSEAGKSMAYSVGDGLVSEADYVAKAVKETMDRAYSEMMASTEYWTKQAEVKAMAEWYKIANKEYSPKEIQDLLDKLMPKATTPAAAQAAAAAAGLTAAGAWAERPDGTRTFLPEVLEAGRWIKKMLEDGSAVLENTYTKQWLPAANYIKTATELYAGESNNVWARVGTVLANAAAPPLPATGLTAPGGVNNTFNLTLTSSGDEVEDLISTFDLLKSLYGTAGA